MFWLFCLSRDTLMIQKNFFKKYYSLSNIKPDIAWHFIEYCELEVGDIQQSGELNISLWELINPILNEIRHAIYVLLYTTKNIQIYSRNCSKTRRYSAITAMSMQ